MKKTKEEIDYTLNGLAKSLSNDTDPVLVITRNDDGFVAAIQGHPKQIIAALIFAMQNQPELRELIEVSSAYLDWQKEGKPDPRKAKPANEIARLTKLAKILAEVLEEDLDNTPLKCQDCEIKDDCEVREVLEGKKPLSDLIDKASGKPKEAQIEHLTQVLRDNGYQC